MLLARPAARNCGLCAESCGGPSWAAAARGQVTGDDLTRLSEHKAHCEDFAELQLVHG